MSEITCPYCGSADTIPDGRLGDTHECKPCRRFWMEDGRINIDTKRIRALEAERDRWKGVAMMFDPEGDFTGDEYQELKADNARLTAELAEVEAASKLLRTEVAKMAGLEYVEITDAGTLAALDRKREELAEARAENAKWTGLTPDLKSIADAYDRERDAINRVWESLGVTEYDGRSVDDHVRALRARLADAEKRIGLHESD